MCVLLSRKMTSLELTLDFSNFLPIVRGMSEVELVKMIGEYGLGAGALIALVIVVVLLIRLMNKMTDNQSAISDNVKENTLATREMMETIRAFRETDKEVVRTMAGCQLKQSMN
jgi:hypothetical protein